MKIDLDKGLTEAQLKKPVSHYMEKVDTAFSIEMTIEDVLHLLRTKKVSTQTSYFYVVDENEKLYGYFSARDLVFNDPQKKLRTIVKDSIIKVVDEAKMEEALMTIVDHQLMAVPVVSVEGRLEGIIEVIPPQFNQPNPAKAIESVTTRDFFQLVGISVSLGKGAAGTAEFRTRMPWLLCNIFSGLICAAIANVYAVTLVKVVILAMFIPLVLTLCESISMQAMALSLQFIHRSAVPWAMVLKRLAIELKGSFLLGIASALIVGFAYLFFSRDLQPMFAISTSIVVSMVCSSVFGVLTPVALHSVSLDPKVAAGPIVLMITDMVTTAIYLGGSTWWLFGT